MRLGRLLWEFGVTGAEFGAYPHLHRRKIAVEARPYADTQCGPLSKLTNIAELQQVATTRLVADVSLSL